MADHCYTECHIEAVYAGWRYAECHCVECRGAPDVAYHFLFKLCKGFCLGKKFLVQNFIIKLLPVLNSGKLVWLSLL
jgi:hypothetical protein